MQAIKFGTDGWRAVISEEFTFDNVKKVAQAIAHYTKTARLKGRSGIIVGYDTRFLSDRYAETVACVMAGNGIKTLLTSRPTPTPSIAYAIKDKKFTGGVVITASHNPPRYNGIKYKAYYAGSAGLKITERIEGYLGKSDVNYIPLSEAKDKGLVFIKDVLPAHLEFVKHYVDLKGLKKSRLKVIVDSMYGTGNGFISELLEGGNCKVVTIHNETNPGFGGISPEPNRENLRELSGRLKRSNYDIGLATDGDADRLGVLAHNGKLLTGHKVMALLLLHLLEDKHMRGAVVQTICGTVLINKICEKYKLKRFETPVGFKYISNIMQKEDVLIGGEETGGIAFKNYIPERDGILSGLLILEMMVARSKPILDILKDIDRVYGTYEYRRLDVKFPVEKGKSLMKFLKNNPPDRILGKRVIKVKDVDGYKFICEDSSWLMLRPSGTEPLLRVYAEASSEKKALEILEFGKRLARHAL